MDTPAILLLLRQMMTLISAIFWFDTFLRARQAARRPWPFIYLTLTAATQFLTRLLINWPGFDDSIFYEFSLIISCTLFLLAAYHMNLVWRRSEPPL